MTRSYGSIYMEVSDFFKNYYIIMKRCRDKWGPALVKTTNATLMQINYQTRPFGSSHGNTVAASVLLATLSGTSVVPKHTVSPTHEQRPFYFGGVHVSSRRVWLCR